MGFAAVAIAVVGAFFLASVNLLLAGGWFFGVFGFVLCLQLEQIADLLRSQKNHNEWLQKIELFRFDHDHPNAAAITAERELATADAKKQRTQNLLAKQAAEKAATTEAKRRASEPTFVAVEAVPDVPADFMAPKKKPNVDFSAIDEVSKPRRKS